MHNVPLLVLNSWPLIYDYDSPNKWLSSCLNHDQIRSIRRSLPHMSSPVFLLSYSLGIAAITLPTRRCRATGGRPLPLITSSSENLKPCMLDVQTQNLNLKPWLNNTMFATSSDSKSKTWKQDVQTTTELVDMEQCTNLFDWVTGGCERQCCQRKQTLLPTLYDSMHGLYISPSTHG